MSKAERTFDVSAPAVVLKLLPNPTRYGGLGVIRSLGRAGVPVYCVLEARSVPAASSRYLAGRCFWQVDHNDAAAVTQGLLRLAEKIGRRAVLFPTDDTAAIFLAEHGDELRSSFTFSNPPAGLPRRLADKREFALLCRELGMATPESCVPASFEEAQEFATRVGFPLVFKVTPPWLAGDVPSTSIIRDAPGLADIYRRCAASGISPMMQEYIQGGPEHDWFFHGYCDVNSICRPAFTGIKERSYPVGSGVTTYGRSAANDKLRDAVTQFLARIEYRGVLDLDIRLNERDGQYNLLDFNPRFGAQSRIFRDTVGVDLAIAAYLDLTGQPIPVGEQVNDRYFMAETYDPRGLLTYRRRGELGLRGWLSQVRSADEFSWFASDDLAPFGSICLRTAWKAATRPFAHGGGTAQ
jgi:predicted ATP-grasp superfamily ATP-dependent carboligase